MGDQYQGLLDPDILEQVFVDILKGVGKRIPQLEIAEVNISKLFVVKVHLIE